MTATIHHGDCLEVLRGMPDNSVDAITCDPPYGLSNTSPDKVTETIVRWAQGDREYVPQGKGFMGASWDAFVPPVAVWDECLRVLKPGGHLVAFAGSRTQDLMGLAIRLAGFDIRENLAWLYGSGFPKSLNVGKATGRPQDEGLGTALKPAHEPIVLARKPLSEKTVAANTLTWGTGGLNIDATRIESETGRPMPRAPQGGILRLHGCHSEEELRELAERGEKTPDGRDARATLERTLKDRARYEREGGKTTNQGRWPANVVLDPDTAKALDQQSGTSVSKAATRGRSGGTFRLGGFNTLAELEAAAARGEHTPDGRNTAQATLDRYLATPLNEGGYDDEGGASRFFKVVEPDPPFLYAAKAPKKERPSYVTEDGQTVQHATVKPLSVMQWLVRLVTPEGGTVLDPFAGSGTTVEAAILEGFNVIGIEREAAYLPLIQQRIDRATDVLPMAS